MNESVDPDFRAASAHALTTPADSGSTLIVRPAARIDVLSTPSARRGITIDVVRMTTGSFETDVDGAEMPVDYGETTAGRA